MDKIIREFKKYSSTFKDLRDKTGLVKKEIFISFLVSKLYKRDVTSEELSQIAEIMKERHIKPRYFEKYIIATFSRICEEDNELFLNKFVDDVEYLKNNNVKINYISKIFLLTSYYDEKKGEIGLKYNQFVKKNYFIKKSKLFPIVYYLNKYEIDQGDFLENYNSNYSLGMVKSSELMYMTLLEMILKVKLIIRSELFSKRTFYPILIILEYLEFEIDEDEIKNAMVMLKNELNANFYDEHYILVALLVKLLEIEDLRDRIGKDVFSILVLSTILSLVKEISYLD